MIRSIRSDKKKFRHAVFQKGFNAVLAERTIEATKRDSTNGPGKSALLEIMHFCLGGKKGPTLSKGHLDDWKFTAELELGGSSCSATRSIRSQNRVGIKGGHSGWPATPSADAAGCPYMSNEDWKRVLGSLMYGLEPGYEQKYRPSFRSLVSYRMRTGGRDSGHLDPFSNGPRQTEWDRQVSTAYLLGLGWEFASRRQDLRDRKNALRQVKAATKSGIIAGVIGSVGELEARRIRLSEQAAVEERELSTFQVHGQYRDLEAKASEYTDLIQGALDENAMDEGLLADYGEGIMSVPDADPDQVCAVYRDAGMVLPDHIMESIRSTVDFHSRVVSNRRDFLSAEIDRVNERVRRRTRLIASLSDKKAKVMSILDSHGALEEFMALQGAHQATLAELRDVDAALENIKKFEEGKSALKVDGEILLREANADLASRRSQREGAVLAFNAYSRRLYKKPGDLTVDVGAGGYKFDIKIERPPSRGFESMKVFCYDLMLATLWSQKGGPPPFLVHDSAIFADVDSRQAAAALTLAKRESERHGFQYICTINHDSVPRGDLDDGFDFDGHVRLRLTDATDDGGLFGFRM